MRLLNFSIGEVQTVQIGSSPVRTAHLKAPIPQPWVIDQTGAVGDQRASHPDKLYAYSRESYLYWGEYLGVDPALWNDGFFAENLTFDVLNEDDLRIGDIFELGSEVRLIVAGPRNPCLKLSWRLGQPQTFQKVFQLSHRTGVYFGVLHTGIVKPGDRLKRVERDAMLPTLPEVAKFAVGHAVPPLEPLRRLLDFDHLSGTIRHILEAKLAAAERAEATVEGRWRGWRPFTIDKIVEETPDIRSIYALPSDGEPIGQPKPGQFVSVKMTGADGETIMRQWSLSAYAYDMDRYRFTVRRQSGLGSNWIHAVEEGAVLDLRAPAGEFHLDMGGFRPLLLIAAGIGVTPLLAILHGHFLRDPNVPAYLIYGARKPTDVAFRAELNEMAATYPALHITFVYSQSDAGGRPAGRITSDMAVETLKDLAIQVGERHIPLPWHETEIYLCGPGDFCQDLKTEFVTRGANADRIFFERFSAQAAEVSELETAQIVFQRTGVTSTWSQEGDLTLLELAESAGVEIANDCRAGACLTCQIAVLEGETTVHMDAGATLMCIGRPKTPRVVLDC